MLLVCQNVLPYEASVGPGARAGGGDVMAGVVGNGTWIDNKQSFVQPAPPKQVLLLGFMHTCYVTSLPCKQFAM